ncbi:MAG: ABC transporter ATP-binding protein [Ruminiclostridium sp.]|nr:ABC transporter ATP-binding protein [Ruminiclostridium sp.]
MYAIKAIDIEMRYKGQVEKAIQPLSFCVEPGEILGLIGHNGSGKSTLLKMLATILIQTSGELFVLGQNSKENGHYIRENLGVFIEPERALYWRLTGYENLQRIACLRKVPKKLFLSQSEKILTSLSLYEDRNKLLLAYSKGMKVKLHIAAAFLGEPRIVLLDEPTAGLDHKSKMQFLSLVREYAEKGNTVVICSHDLVDMQHLCNRVLLLHMGEKIALGQPADLMRNFPGEGSILIKSLHTEEIAKWAKECLKPLKVHFKEDCVTVLTEHLIEDILTIRNELRFDYNSISYREKELSDILVYCS